MGLTRWGVLVGVLSALALGCGDDDGVAPPDAGGDGGAAEDAGPPTPAPTDHCTYELPNPTAGAGGTVEAGALEAGVAEGWLSAPVGTALGAYTARVDFLGDIDPPDRRFNGLSGTFAPSVGIETRPQAKALALRAGGETVVLLKVDAGLADEAITHEVAARLGEAYDIDLSGKVLFATSHSHAAWAQYTANSILWVGLGRKRGEVVEALVSDLVRVGGEALDALEPARLGVAHDGAFDPDDRITRDRRPQNDALMGGPRKDDDLFVIRVDASADGRPLAIVPVFGIHGTVLGADNLLASTEVTGAIERAIEKNFEEPVVVMHLQGAGGDVSPAGTGGIRCDGQPCYDFARMEMVGRLARDVVLTLWSDAGEAMEETLALEMLTRHVALGPDWENFVIRDGALRYAPWDGETFADGMILDGDAVLSPIDEFNAPTGAALCGEDNNALFPQSQLPGTAGADTPYQSCADTTAAARILSRLMDLPFEPMPACATTRTTVSALRLGDHLLLTLPGEPHVELVDRIRASSPIAGERTLVVGHAQDHMGYAMSVEDWLARGYEPSINVWGPLEGELIAERLVELAPLALTDTREDATDGFADRYLPLPVDDSDLGPPAAAPMAGTVEDVPWEDQLTRTGEPLASGQPAAEVPRLGSATFAWIGEDPRSGTPTVTLEREVGESWEPLRRRSGRAVRDQDLLIFHTPDPLILETPDTPLTHRWLVEWQAVTPWGTPDLDGLGDRFGVPLGRYRFRVEGTGYAMESDPFEVTPAAVELEAAASGGRLQGTARFHAPQGWRLRHPTLPSNEPVPASGPVTLRVATGDGEVVLEDVALDAEGRFDVALPSGATAVTLEDRFGNTGSAPL